MNAESKTRDASVATPPELTERMRESTLIAAAEALARRAHAGEMRKDATTPYITHPLNVAGILARYGAGAEAVAAGLLHDTIEDTDVTGNDIERTCTATVRELVEEASEPDKSLSWHARKTHTIGTMAERSHQARLVIAADKLDNVNSIGREIARDGEAAWKQMFKTGRDDQAWYYTTMAAKLNAHAHPLFSELRAAVAEVFGERTMLATERREREQAEESAESLVYHVRAGLDCVEMLSVGTEGIEARRALYEIAHATEKLGRAMGLAIDTGVTDEARNQA